MMTEAHFSQPSESPAHVTRCGPDASCALGIGPPAIDTPTEHEGAPWREFIIPALAPLRQHAYAHITMAEDVPRAPGRSRRSSNKANVGWRGTRSVDVEGTA